MARTETSSYLVELQQYFRSNNKNGWDAAATIGVECKTDLQVIDDLLAECQSTQNAFDVFRARYGPSLGELCTCLLLFRAIEKVIPDDEVRAWMEKPNEELAGRTPLACIYEGSFDSVFEALWRRDDTPGPAS